jgi:hypothetical protein
MEPNHSRDSPETTQSGQMAKSPPFLTRAFLSIPQMELEELQSTAGFLAGATVRLRRMTHT